MKVTLLDEKTPFHQSWEFDLKNLFKVMSIKQLKHNVMMKHAVEVHAPYLMLYIEQNPNQQHNVGNVPTKNSNTRT